MFNHWNYISRGRRRPGKKSERDQANIMVNKVMTFTTQICIDYTIYIPGTYVSRGHNEKSICLSLYSMQLQ